MFGAEFIAKRKLDIGYSDVKLGLYETFPHDNAEQGFYILMRLCENFLEQSVFSTKFEDAKKGKQCLPFLIQQPLVAESSVVEESLLRK